MIDVVHGGDQPRFEGEQKQSEGVRSAGDREVHGRRRPVEMAPRQQIGTHGQRLGRCPSYVTNSIPAMDARAKERRHSPSRAPEPDRSSDPHAEGRTGPRVRPGDAHRRLRVVNSSRIADQRRVVSTVASQAGSSGGESGHLCEGPRRVVEFNGV